MAVTNRPYRPANLTVGGFDLTLTEYLGKGLLADVRQVELKNDTTGSQFYAKIARSAKDNDLLEREHRHLLRLASPAVDPTWEEIMSTQRISIPHPLISALLNESDAEGRRINIQCVAPAFHLTAQELHEVDFPKGMPLEHVYWIFRRTLLTIWVAHEHGRIVHGGVTPDHVLVYPDQVEGKPNKGHGVVLIDWTGSAVIETEKVPILNPVWEEFYPPEIRKKSKASPTMDIFMAAATALYLAGGKVDERIAPTSMPEIVANDLLSCLNEDPCKRPHDAEEFYRHFGETIEAAHGKREYAPLEI